jgi:transcription elongation factor Elf1
MYEDLPNYFDCPHCGAVVYDCTLHQAYHAANASVGDE